MQSIESVLSQRDLPDELGLVIGDSVDSTDEFAGFYSEEFDFVHEQHIRASTQGRSRLRLEGLERVSSERIMFLPGDVFLFRDSISTLKTSNYKNDIIPIMACEFRDSFGNKFKWLPEENLEWIDVLENYSLLPHSVLWPVDHLKQISEFLNDREWGPFSTLGWLWCMAEAECEVDAVTEPLMERWGLIEGDFCWSKDTRTTAKNLTRYQSESSLKLKGRRPLLEEGLPARSSKQSISVTYNHENSGVSEENLWGSQRVPLPE